MCSKWGLITSAIVVVLRILPNEGWNCSLTGTELAQKDENCVNESEQCCSTNQLLLSSCEETLSGCDFIFPLHYQSRDLKFESMRLSFQPFFASFSFGPRMG